MDWLAKSLIPQGGQTQGLYPGCSSLLPGLKKVESSDPPRTWYGGSGLLCKSSSRNLFEARTHFNSCQPRTQLQPRLPSNIVQFSSLLRLRLQTESPHLDILTFVTTPQKMLSNSNLHFVIICVRK